MKKIFALAVCSLLISYQKISAQIADSNMLTLKQAIELAEKNNPLVQQSDLQLQTSAINLNQAKKNVLPDLFGNVGHGINQGRSIDPFTNSYINQAVGFGNYGVSSAVVLFSGFQLKNLIRQSALTHEANKLDIQQTKDNIRLNVILAYLQILNNQDQLAQAQSQVEVTKKQIDRLNVMNESGAIVPTLLYDLKGQLANDELAITSNRNALNAAKLTLSQLMNIAYNQNLNVERLNADEFSPLYDGDPTSIYNHSEKNLALVKAANLRLESARKGVEVAKGSLYPTISLSGNLNTNYSSAAQRETFLNTMEIASGDFVTVNGNKVPVITQRSNYSAEGIPYGNQFTNNYNTSVYLNVRVPIFNASRARNRIALATIEQKSAELSAQNIKTRLAQDIEQAYFTMAGALERYKTLQQQVKDFEESFRIAEVRFNAGVLTQVDYLVAKNNVDRAKNNLIIARYDFVFRTKILDYYKGQSVIQ